MQKLTLIETKAIVDGTIENPSTPFEISLEKGIDSAINSLITRIHQLATAFQIGKTKGASVVYSISVDGIQTSIAFGSGIGLTIKENSKEAYLKEAGLKKMTLTAFTMDYTAFRIAHPVIASVVKYHLGAYLDADTRAESYKATAKAIFKKDIKEGKSDLASWSVQTRATAEKSLYGIQDKMAEAAAENTDEYMESRRESSLRAIAFKSEQRKLIAASNK
jgi:hypothetical protein